MFLISWPGGSPETTALYAAVVIGAYTGVIWLASIAWTFRDVSQRTQSAPARLSAGLLVMLTFLAGLVVYLILRPRLTLQQRFELKLEEEALLQEIGGILACPECARPVKEDFIACPACKAQLRIPCVACAKPLSNSWQICPYCTTPAASNVPARATEPRRKRARESGSPIPVAARTMAPELVPSAPVSAMALPNEPHRQERDSAPAATTTPQQGTHASDAEFAAAG